MIGRQSVGDNGGEESEAGEKGTTEIEIVEEVKKMLGVYCIRRLLEFERPDWLDSPQHEDVGVGQVAACRAHLLQNVQTTSINVAG